MVWTPAAPNVVGRLAVADAAVALPAVPVTCTGAPMVAAPFLKVIVPVGATPGASAVVCTVALSVTFCPVLAVVGPVAVVVVVAGVIVKTPGGDEMLGLKLGSPLYWAMTECGPAFKITGGSVSAALSWLIFTLAASVVTPLSTNFTVPVAIKLPVAAKSETSARRTVVCG